MHRCSANAKMQVRGEGWTVTQGSPTQMPFSHPGPTHAALAS